MIIKQTNKWCMIDGWMESFFLKKKKDNHYHPKNKNFHINDSMLSQCLSINISELYQSAKLKVVRHFFLNKQVDQEEKNIEIIIIMMINNDHRKNDVLFFFEILTFHLLIIMVVNKKRIHFLSPSSSFWKSISMEKNFTTFFFCILFSPSLHTQREKKRKYDSWR